MASQNARLVVGYCAKKAELKRIQEALAAERARWEVGICSPYLASDKHCACRSNIDLSQCLASEGPLLPRAACVISCMHVVASRPQ